MNFAARSTPLERDGDDRGIPVPRDAPVEPSWIEEARKAFAKRFHDEHGDDYENSPNVYGA